jgi:hypothetical protein
MNTTIKSTEPSSFAVLHKLIIFLRNCTFFLPPNQGGKCNFCDKFISSKKNNQFRKKLPSPHKQGDSPLWNKSPGTAEKIAFYRTLGTITAATNNRSAGVP